MRHPEATTVALLLTAEKQQPGRDLEEATHVVLARYFEDWPDEKKADLYALLAEKVSADMSFMQTEQIVSRCLWDNDNQWAAR